MQTSWQKVYLQTRDLKSVSPLFVPSSNPPANHRINYSPFACAKSLLCTLRHLQCRTWRLSADGAHGAVPPIWKADTGTGWCSALKHTSFHCCFIGRLVFSLSPLSRSGQCPATHSRGVFPCERLQIGCDRERNDWQTDVIESFSASAWVLSEIQSQFLPHGLSLCWLMRR